MSLSTACCRDAAEGLQMHRARESWGVGEHWEETPEDQPRWGTPPACRCTSCKPGPRRPCQALSGAIRLAAPHDLPSSPRPARSCALSQAVLLHAHTPHRCRLLLTRPSICHPPAHGTAACPCPLHFEHNTTIPRLAAPHIPRPAPVPPCFCSTTSRSTGTRRLDQNNNKDLVCGSRGDNWRLSLPGEGGGVPFGQCWT